MPSFINKVGKKQDFAYTRKGMNEYLRAKKADGALPVSREKEDEEGRPLDEEGDVIPEPTPKPPAPEAPSEGPSLGKVIVKDKDGKILKVYPATPNGVKAAKDHAKRVGGEIFHEMGPAKPKPKPNPSPDNLFPGRKEKVWV
jgi:hypothetical protein